MSAFETARELARRMPERWGLRAAPSVLDFSGGLSATLLEAKPAEVSSPPGDAHIVSLIVRGERRHRMWRDGKLMADGALRAGSVNFVVAGVAPRAVISEPVKVLHVYVPAPQLALMAEGAGSRDAVGLEVIDPLFTPDPPMEAIMSAIATCLDDGRWTERLWLDSLGTALGARMIQRWSNFADMPPRQNRGGLGPLRLQQVCEFLEQHLAAEPRLGALAALTGLSPAHFCRAFAASTGLPPHQWLRRRRIERARDLLEQTSLPVGEIAARTGYADPAYFARLFRRVTGVTPLAYRRERSS